MVDAARARRLAEQIKVLTATALELRQIWQMPRSTTRFLEIKLSPN
jgi:hypothetical protein